MENNYKWKFSKIDLIENFMFNKSLESFYEYGIGGLVRENIQNSLDAKLPDSDKRVEVIIEIDEIDAINIPGINEIKDRVYTLKGGNTQTEETIASMKKEIKF